MMKFRNLDAAYEALMAAALNSAVMASPRGLATRELSNVFLTIENPRERFITNPARKWSLPLAFGELAWHLSGSQDVEALASYAKIWRRFSTGATVDGSCYGHRIFRKTRIGKTQWEICRDALVADGFSRRAVIQLYDPEQNFPSSPDVSCALNIQFIARHGLLDATVFMRSNDVYFGFPYDVFLYSNLQELMAVELGLKLGAYHHFVTSLHLYEKDAARAEDLLRNRTLSGEFSDLPLLRSDESEKFCQAEASIRSGGKEHASILFVDEFWRQKCLLLVEARQGGPTGSFYSDLMHR
ncbi:thymidylate synthase [Bradyrhizobium sp. McL0615]|uniref:thymidylate synthase n=1 Tax=Bradyrhizobium sp. McL0615 TaxID=3415673 RepID=UPI003CF49B53